MSAGKDNRLFKSSIEIRLGIRFLKQTPVGDWISSDDVPEAWWLEKSSKNGDRLCEAKRGEARGGSGSADARGNRIQVQVSAAGRREAPPSAGLRRRLRRHNRLPALAADPELREGPRVSHALPSPQVNMAPAPKCRADGPVIPSEQPSKSSAGADGGLRRSGQALAPSSPRLWGGQQGAQETAGGRVRSLRVRRFRTRRLRSDTFACAPKNERKRKRILIETLQPAAAEKSDRPRELPPTSA
ncbi:hypothetical protein P7K49_036281 [Saguinus oedipus]|uniref:Uncharacterized protein n=1 Tax=Saguinus oedipus TaxID=9490 RepID=A0ABQ9TJZ3_SAGOE|nr:hypothetical protein P7K49_036281 [Saguinus oedipus]